MNFSEHLLPINFFKSNKLRFEGVSFSLPQPPLPPLKTEKTVFPLEEFDWTDFTDGLLPQNWQRLGS